MGTAGLHVLERRCLSGYHSLPVTEMGMSTKLPQHFLKSQQSEFGLCHASLGSLTPSPDERTSDH